MVCSSSQWTAIGISTFENIFSRESRSSTNMFPVDEPKKSLIAGILLVSFFNISSRLVLVPPNINE